MGVVGGPSHHGTRVNARRKAAMEAVTLAEADGLGGGVVATGSGVTAADIRLLLGVKET